MDLEVFFSNLSYQYQLKVILELLVVMLDLVGLVPKVPQVQQVPQVPQAALEPLEPRDLLVLARVVEWEIQDLKDRQDHLGL